MQPGAAVELAFLEIMEPPLADAVAKLAKSGHKRITVAPLFLAQGGHMKNDLPKILNAIRAEHRGTDITLLPAIGDVDVILDAISAWLIGDPDEKTGAGPPLNAERVIIQGPSPRGAQ